MNLRISDAVERVKTDLQLSAPDAAVYVHLCTAGPAKVSELADALHVHRNDVYRTAERLVQRGLVQTTMERPARFIAVAPGEAFDHEIAQRLATIDQLRRSRTEVMALVEQLHALTPAPPKGIYKILQGRPAIYAQREAMIQGARKSVAWVASTLNAIPHADVGGAVDLMIERARQGVAFQLLLRSTPESASRLADLRALPQVEAREFACDTPVRFVIVDDTELLMWVVDDPSESLYAENEVAMYTTASGFVHAQRQLVQTAWSAAPGMG